MRTKIVATLGPASASQARVLELSREGVDVFRVNMAHSSGADLRTFVDWVRGASDALDRPIAVLADLAGPKIRVGQLGRPLELIRDEMVVVAPEGGDEGAERGGESDAGELVIPTTYDGLAGDVEPGRRILLDDGLMELVVEAIEGARVRCRVIQGGRLLPHKGLNLPGVRVGAPSLTAKDRTDLDAALEAEVDLVGLSFVQRREDVDTLRALLDDDGPRIVAKIEKDVALENIRSILEATDAVMVARGDLGVELPFEQVPVAQKRIIQLANLYHRPVITATQMLESMMDSPRPTRAEASDVANALFDGTDAVMLSGETAAGQFPMEAVRAMGRIIAEIERTEAYDVVPKYDVPPVDQLRPGATPDEHAIAVATAEAGRLLNAAAIVSLTRTGATARLVSSYRPPMPILGVTHGQRTWRQLSLVWGVKPLLCPTEPTYDHMVGWARHWMLEKGIGRPGEPFLVTAGIPFHVPGTTNMLRVEHL